MINNELGSWMEVPIALAGWSLCPHARRAIFNRGFAIDDVAAALTTPQHPRPAPDFGRDRWTYEYRHVLVPVELRSRTVITVLPRRWHRGRWSDLDVRSMNGR